MKQTTKAALGGLLWSSIFAVPMIFLMACEDGTTVKNEVVTQPIDKPEYAPYKVISADGCQYIKFYYVDPYIHKGNCNNPIHPQNIRK